MISLDQLRPGQRGCILSMSGADRMVQRLQEMGLLEGDVVEVIGFAPLGDPMEIRIGDSRLSLRRADAALIQLAPQS